MLLGFCQKDSSVLQSETKEDIELSKVLQELQDIFTDDILGDLPPIRKEEMIIP